ncbi:MAG: NYN domain-containing protein [Verrucomicrobia bacterium]|nr:NYN domain-containing protein [Verrucomicrobiota bacterium]
MSAEPATKRAVAFIDGQNLFYAAKTTFGYSYPNYDPKALTQRVCQQRGWGLVQSRFYTGFPSAEDNAFWHHFWQAKILQLHREGVHVFSRQLRYRLQTVKLRDGTTHSAVVGQEKGVDVRLAIDVISLAHQNAFDVAVIFSQDQDLSEVADGIRVIAKLQDRWIKVASAFPVSPVPHNKRGINGTDWIKIDRATYDGCLDARDYRPKSKS